MWQNAEVYPTQYFKLVPYCKNTTVIIMTAKSTQKATVALAESVQSTLLSEFRKYSKTLLIYIFQD